MKRFLLVALATISALPGSANANDWAAVGKVTRIEASYAPNQLPFQIDMPAGSCAARDWLRWNAQGPDAATKNANYQAILSVVLTAKTTGQQVAVYGDNANCTVNFVHLIE